MKTVTENIAELLATALALSLRFEGDSSHSNRQERLHALLLDYQGHDGILDEQPVLHCPACVECHNRVRKLLAKFRG